MAQPTDIVLNNAGYMIEPGTPTNPGYRKLQDGYPEGLTHRTAITDFFGGQHRSHQLERDKFYDSRAVGPVLGGQGVTPWGLRVESSLDLTGNTMPDRNTRIPHVTVRDALYFAIGRDLYRGGVANGALGPTLIKTYPHTITDLTIYGSIGILIAFGSASDLLFRHTVLDSEVELFQGERAHRVEAYAGYAMWTDARANATPTIIRMVTGDGVDSRHVSYDVFDMAPVDGKIMLVTKQALFSFSGRVADIMRPNPGYDPNDPASPPQMPGQSWTGEFTPFFQQGVYTEQSDFSFFESYGGKPIAWISGGVHEFVPSGDRAGWRSTGLTGKRCFGGCIAAGYAIVSIESHSGNNELWAYDGNGWWCFDRQPMTEPTWCWPLSVGTTLSGWNLQVHRHGEETNHAYRLQPLNDGDNYPSTAELVTPLIDAGDRDKIKAWRKIGAVFSSPELHGNTTSGDNVLVALDYSTNAGETWHTVFSDYSQVWAGSNGNSLAAMNFDIEEVLQGVTSRFIQLRVRWGSVSDWAPILTGLWVEHEALSSPARRRKWQLRIHARDQEIDRDGMVIQRTGRQLIDELWQSWETDTPIPFRDIDYDADPTERTVRIVGIQEHVALPADANNWGDSMITLNLVEV